MDLQRWQQIDQLFHSALAHDSSERAAFLAHACVGDDALLKEVESLLESHEQSESFFDAPAADIAADLLTGSAAQLAAGQSLGHYQIVSLLGEGGMGEVYLAQDTRLGRKVALKRLPAQFTLDTERVRRFEHEARAVSALNHPNIVTIHEIGHSDSSHFITTEFIDGETLRQYLASNRLKLNEVLDIAAQIASALAAAHAAGIVHRDIKPENVMVRHDGYVKVLDFGLAKLVEQKKSFIGLEDETNRQNMTAPGVIVGTVNYMSPEQAKGEPVDERTDIFSFGVLLYEMLTGRTPFAGNSVSETLANLLKSEPQPLGRFAVNVPDDLQQIVSKTLPKEKDARYQTMRELLEDLRDLKENISFEEKLERAALPDDNTTATRQAATGSLNKQVTKTQHSLFQQISQHRPLVLVALVVSLVGVLGLSYWLYKIRSTSAGAKQIESIAVLPFQNVNGDANLEYLSDGLSESIIDRLSGVPQLKVIARNSSFKFRGQDDWQKAANALGVRAIVTGRVMRQGDSLTIRVELVDVQENRQLWSQQYIRSIADASMLQDEITQMISEKLSLKLSGAQEQQLAQHKTINPQAFELALKGRFYSLKGGVENWEKGVDYYQQAIAADPNYAPAYAGLFWAYRSLLTRGVVNPLEFVPKAANAAHKALALDPNLAEAHLALGYTLRDAWKWNEAEASYKRALELNPNLSSAHGVYSAYLSVMGRHDEAVAEAKRAMELDPFSPLNNTNTSFVLFLARRYDEAIVSLKKTVELDRNNSTAHLILGLVYTEKGMFREAIAAHQEAIRLDKISPNLQISLATAYARSGEREQARTILSQLQASQSHILPTDLAVFYTAMGEREQAFASLDQAYAAHDIQLQYLAVGPAYDALRNDPRFNELVRRVGLK